MDQRPVATQWVVQAVGLFAWVVLCFAVAAFGSQFQPGPWYAGLAKPGWTPPDWVFAPVWSLLYLLMALAAWLVWRRGGFARAGPALTVFLVQLLLNGLWSYLFFGLNRIGAAMLEILLLWLAILATLVLFRRHSALAAGLLVPYLAWVGYAAALNFALWGMNV